MFTIINIIKVISLLRDCETYSLPFESFISAYQHHFEKELKFCDYGCSKLQELFDSVPDIIELKHENQISLKIHLRLKILSGNIHRICIPYIQ